MNKWQQAIAELTNIAKGIPNTKLWLDQLVDVLSIGTPHVLHLPLVLVGAELIASDGDHLVGCHGPHSPGKVINTIWVCHILLDLLLIFNFVWRVKNSNQKRSVPFQDSYCFLACLGIKAINYSLISKKDLSFVVLTFFYIYFFSITKCPRKKMR